MVENVEQFTAEAVRIVLLMRKKQKTNKKRSLRDKAWKVFSKFIRERDKTCVTCETGNADNAGHFWHGVLDFDEENVNGQCVRCNKWLSGNLSEYAIYLIKKLGLKKFLDLYERKKVAQAGEYRTEEDYQNIIDKYEN